MSKSTRHVDGGAMLHYTHLERFKEYAVIHGYALFPLRDVLYEVLRLQELSMSGHPPNPVLYFYKRDAAEHITIPDGAQDLVRAYVRWAQKSKRKLDRSIR